ncbi:RDR2-independent DNA methylation protein [Heracleum sosnowskyi]|uniref:RDR2-independent DNA methylation protein n=1 Tax=Heracleum sosnowskyi TaxID=360622 RepID=A0AAD8HLV5_9APIA|nr:RDR2-independent DNA methylation protein [Heracleum sosnowskyi]
MEENDDNSSIKSSVENQEHIVRNKCGEILVDFKECDFDDLKLLVEANEGLISVNKMLNHLDEERVMSFDNELSVFVCGVETGDFVIESKDVFEIDVEANGGNVVEAKGVCEIETERKGVGEVESGVLKSNDVFEIEGNGINEVEGEDVYEKIEGGLEVVNVLEVVNESEVKGFMEEVVKLEGKVVSESEMEDVLGTELEAVKADCETRLSDKDVGEIDDEVKGKCETIGTKLMAESDEVDNVGEENVEMEFVVGELLNGDEVIDGMSKDKLENSSGLAGVADDKAMEDTSLVMDYESKGNDDVMESVPELSDEDGMEIARGDNGDEVEVVVSQPDSVLQSAEDEEDEKMVGDEDISAADIEMETGIEADDSKKITGGKRKRGKNTKAAAKAAAKAQIRNALPVEEEDVCFICFDGGDLVLCDRKNCPKAYHPSCVNRDEKFFRAKGRWNCGWHQCSHKNCQKNAYYMCYTCTFSLCKGCIKDAVILCVRGNKGFCEGCIKIVMMIEDTAQANQAQIDFDDKSSWEYLFKDYWIDLKNKLSISPVEIAQAKNPWKLSNIGTGKNESPCELLDIKNGGAFCTDNTSDNPEASEPKMGKYKKRPKSRSKQNELTCEAVSVGSEGRSTTKSTEWASTDLLELVMHMRDGDVTVLSQFDVQALLLEYIKRNKLRDPHRKSQIICDARLEKIFGKARVGHFEILKLLESHFLIKEDTQIDDVQGSVVDTETSHLDADGNDESLTKNRKVWKRKPGKKGGRGCQSNLDDYAAIDIHNISLIYLRRKLMEDLLEDLETFNDKVVGTFVRIRISASNQNQDIYRLVQVKGVSKVDDYYRVGKRTTNLMLEIVNLNKTEVISIDSISNQEFTEDECKRLRQSIKCGLIDLLTVGVILDKAMEVQVARVNAWLESELLRLTHLRDRASDLGKKKQLRECVEGLQLLRRPEERKRRLEDIPEIHADPKMEPNFKSEDNDSEIDSYKQEMSTRDKDSGFSRRRREPISPGSGDVNDSWSGDGNNSSKNGEFNRNLSMKTLANKVEDAPLDIGISTDNSWNHGRGSQTEKLNILENPTLATSSEALGLNSTSAARSDSFSHAQPQIFPAALTSPVSISAINISEKNKMWHYEDPQKKVQGPFSMVQLRKWSNTGYFPADLRIWSSSGNKDDSLLLTDALEGKFLPASRNWAVASVEVPVLSADKANPNYSGRNNWVNLPSSTPKQSSARECPPTADVTLLGSIDLHSPAAATPDSTRTSKLVSENSFSSSAFDASPNPEQGNFAVSTNSLDNAQSTAAAQSNGVQSVSHPFIVPETNGNIVNLVTGQNPASGTQGWGSSLAQILEANSLNQASNQHPAYPQWDGVPSTPVQNPATNFPMPGVSQLRNPWRPPSENNQSISQPNVQWGMGIADNSAPAQNLQPENLTSSLVSVQVIPNMGWVGPNPNINLVASVQGPPPMNMNAGWVASAGNPGAGFQGAVPGNVNPGWVAQPSNASGSMQMVGPTNVNQCWLPNMTPNAQGAVSGNGNASLVAPTSNLGPNVQGQRPGNANLGWSAASGNANQGWGSPAGSQGNNRREHQRNGNKFSGQRDQGCQRGRNWNQQSSYRGGGSTHSCRGICYVFRDTGHCRRGDSCRFRHSS